VPRRYQTSLSRDDVVAYLNEYASHFGLQVITGTTVRRIRRANPGDGEWIVEIAGGDESVPSPAITRCGASTWDR
jgi:putative flavoprotein involved in K+ transport